MMRSITGQTVMALAAIMALAALPANIAHATEPSPTPKLILLYYHADW